MSALGFLIDKRNHSSGVVVAEVRLQGMTGLDLCEQLPNDRSEFPVVLLASHLDVPDVVAGNVIEIVLKPVAMESLKTAITRATEGEVFTDGEHEVAFRRLTEREQEIAALVVEGKSSREIGAVLGVSIETAEAHRARIMDKTRADDVGELVRLWRAWTE